MQQGDAKAKAVFLWGIVHVPILLFLTKAYSPQENKNMPVNVNQLNNIPELS